jgi:hypothetical protein
VVQVPALAAVSWRTHSSPEGVTPSRASRPSAFVSAPTVVQPVVTDWVQGDQALLPAAVCSRRTSAPLLVAPNSASRPSPRGARLADSPTVKNPGGPVNSSRLGVFGVRPVTTPGVERCWTSSSRICAGEAPANSGLPANSAAAPATKAAPVALVLKVPVPVTGSSVVTPSPGANIVMQGPKFEKALRASPVPVLPTYTVSGAAPVALAHASWLESPPVPNTGMPAANALSCALIRVSATSSAHGRGSPVCVSMQ